MISRDLLTLAAIPFVLLSSTLALPQRRGECTNKALRKEWSTSSDDEKRAYIEGIKCLMQAPSQLPEGYAPGAKNRYDDFAATHITIAYNVHFSGTFFAFHRHLVFLLERAMRDECGYQGYLPYMYWPNYSQDLRTSSLFDGRELSLSGDGEYISSAMSPPNGNYIPPATQGGGCVKKGPFGNMTVHFREFSRPTPDRYMPPDALEYNPHCFRRNLNSQIMQNSNGAVAISRLMSQPNITQFQRTTDRSIYPEGINTPDYGAHAGGHFSIGPQMEDYFASPADPVFWLHHGMIDRVWADWQAIDPEDRQYALNGTDMYMNDPAGTEVTVDYQLDAFGYLDGAQRMGDLMDVTKGPYCYEYGPSSI